MKSYKRLLALALTAVMGITAFAGCGTASTSSTVSAGGSNEGSDGGTKTIEVAILNGMAPYTYCDENGDFQGYDYEFLTKVDEMLDEYEFHYNSVDPDAGAAAVQAGTYALSCSAHFVTPAREENFILSYPESYYPVNLISRKEDSFTKFEDLDGKALVPNPPNDGLYVALYNMAKDYPDVKFTQEEVSNYIPYADGCRGVANGQWDCWFGGDTMFYDIMKEEPMDLFCSEPVGCAACVVLLNKEYTELRDKINECIVTMYKDGTFSELSEKWLDKDVWKIAEDTGTLDDVFKS